MSFGLTRRAPFRNSITGCDRPRRARSRARKRKIADTEIVGGVLGQGMIAYKSRSVQATDRPQACPRWIIRRQRSSGLSSQAATAILSDGRHVPPAKTRIRHQCCGVGAEYD
jgi:hypothetical protein